MTLLSCVATKVLATLRFIGFHVWCLRKSSCKQHSYFFPLQSVNARFEVDHVSWVLGREVRRPAILDPSLVEELKNCVPDGITVRNRRLAKNDYEYFLLIMVTLACSH